MAIKKKEINFNDIKNKFSTKTKYKETQFYNCGEAFMDACGLPGPVMGGISMFLGHSNAGKTTAMILAATDAQRKGHLPVFIITEKKWSWDHAVELGLDAKKNEDGEWEGMFIFNDSFDVIEQATDFINDVLDAQEKGDIPYNLLFLWDSIGSIPCQMTYDGKGGGMFNAKVLADKIGMGIHSRITKSKKEDYPYYNTLVILNQPWVLLPDNPFGQPAKNGRKISFAIRTKISILKNHVNGLGFKDSKIIAVHNGFIGDTKEALDKYKKDYSDYWANKMGGNEFTLEESKNDDFE